MRLMRRFLIALFAASGASAAGLDETGWKPNGIVATIDLPQNGASITVPVTIGGTRHVFILDTGSTSTAFDPALAKYLGPGTPSTERMFGDSVPVTVHQLERCLDVAGLAVPQLESVAVLDLTEIRRYVPRCAGILGMDVLRHFFIHLDFDRRVLFLAPGHYTQSPPGSLLKLTLDRSRRPVVKAACGDMPDLFLIDTGYSGTGAISPKLVALLQEQRKLTSTGVSSLGIRADGKSKGLDQGRCTAFSIGSHRHENLVFLKEDHSIIGLCLLVRYRTSFDFAKGQLYLEPGLSFGLRDRGDYDGLIVATTDEQLNPRVTIVVPGSAADLAGFRVGDALLGVNGLPSQELSELDRGLLLFAPRRADLRMRIGREGKDLQLTLPGG